MDNIIEGLGANKVNIDIKTNQMNEKHIFENGDPKELPFDNFDKIFENFRQIGNQIRRNGYAMVQQQPHLNPQLQTHNMKTPFNNAPPNENINSMLSDLMDLVEHQARSLQDSIRIAKMQKIEKAKALQDPLPQPQPQQQTQPLNDKLLYSFMIRENNTVSLLNNEAKNKHTKQYGDLLVDNLKNESNAYKKYGFKSIGIKLEDLVLSISSQRTDVRPLLLYEAYRAGKNIVYKDDMYMIDNTADSYIYLDDNDEDCMWKDRTGLQVIIKEYISKYVEGDVENMQQKLKKKLVSDLKDLSKKLCLPLNRLEDSKKHSLSKEEIITKICDLYNSST